MILWTIQTIEAWEILQRTGTLRCDPNFSEKDFLDSYKWIAEQMHKRLQLDAPEGAFPLWAWYQWDGERRRRPDMRARGHLPPGEKGCRIEFEIDDNQVLLSDFDLWHFVLNYWYLAASMTEDEAFDARLAEKGLFITNEHPLPDPDLDAAIRKSWERIFDLDWYEEDMTHPKEKKIIQATFWELSMDSVKRVDEFTGR
jgi:hypothetical protein